MVSIPRDLYYNGRKINSYYAIYGTDGFIKVLENITGLKIHKYIIIDMFAFIEAIDAIGGVDVCLNNDLIDPTYRVKDDGKWSTLYYKKGCYHFTGVQALRIARSRHYSSDFARAKRQHKILVSIKEKFQDIGPSDMNIIYDLIYILMKYVDTNTTPVEFGIAFMKYKDYGISAQYVLDTSNVLYSTYSNIHLIQRTGGDTSEIENKGAYILLPKNNNWNVIKWYINNLVVGE